MWNDILDLEGLNPNITLPTFVATFTATTKGMEEKREKFCTCVFCQRTNHHRIITMAADNELLECPHCGLQFISRRKES